MLSFKTFLVDEKGQETGETSTIEIPDGWWVVTLNCCCEPNELFSNRKPWSEHKLYGVESSEVRYGVTDIFSTVEMEGYIIGWQYVIAAPRRFVLVSRGDWRSESCLIAREVHDRKVLKHLSCSVPLSYKRGDKGWRWVRLEEVLHKLGKSFEDISELCWELTGKKVRTGRPGPEPYEFNYDEEAYDEYYSSQEARQEELAHCFYIKIALDSPKSRRFAVSLPTSERDYKFKSRIEKYPLSQIWIPAGLAHKLVSIIEFVH